MTDQMRYEIDLASTDENETDTADIMIDQMIEDEKWARFVERCKTNTKPISN